MDRSETCGRALLCVVVRRPTNAVQLLVALPLLAAFAVVAHKVLQLLGLLFRDPHAGAVEPVGAKIAPDVEPAREERERENVLSLQNSNRIRTKTWQGSPLSLLGLVVRRLADAVQLGVLLVVL